MVNNSELTTESEQGELQALALYQYIFKPEPLTSINKLL